MPQRPAIVELGEASSIEARILVADDFEPCRLEIRSWLERKTNWHIIEACDGLEAVQKAVKLHPDVVLLDVSMPRLNGIEAARRIRELSPQSVIVFLSENADEDVIAAALETGAAAFVLKREMRAELIPTIQMVLLVQP